MKKMMFAAAALCAAVVFCSCSKTEPATETSATPAAAETVEKAAPVAEAAAKPQEEAAPAAPAAEAKTFTVGFDASFPPYGFRADDGSFKGFDLDLAAEVAKRNGWKLGLKAIDWAAKDSELNAGTIDCIWNGFTITEERMKQYTWSKPYVQNKQVILVKRDSGLKAFADLKGKGVAAQDGSSGAEAVEGKLKDAQAADAEFAFKDYKKVPDYVTALNLLKSGAVDALALDSAVAAGFITKEPGAYYVFEETLMDEKYGIGFKLGNTELRDIVEKTVMEMVADGTCAKILKHWAENEEKNGGDGIDFILK